MPDNVTSDDVTADDTDDLGVDDPGADDLAADVTDAAQTLADDVAGLDTTEPDADAPQAGAPEARGLGGRSSRPVIEGVAYMTYEQFGRRFFELAVTEERIGAAFTAIAGEEFRVGPMPSGPGGVAKVIADVAIAEPQITRTVGDTISFTVKLPLHIALLVDLKLDRIRYDVDGLVTLPLTVRCAEPLQLRIEVQTPRPRDVFVDVNSHNIRGSIIRNLAQVDDEIRRVIAKFVAEEVEKPEVRKARLIDVDVELGRAFESM